MIYCCYHDDFSVDRALFDSLASNLICIVQHMKHQRIVVADADVVVAAADAVAVVADAVVAVDVLFHCVFYCCPPTA